LRYSLRALLKRPSFAAGTMLVLGLAVGVNTAVFSLVNALLLRPLAYDDAGRLARIFGSVPPGDNPNGPARRVPAMQVAELAPLRAQTKTLSHVAFYLPMQATLSAADGAVRIEGARVTADTFAMLGARPVVGRVFESREEASGADAVAILSDVTWQRQFGGAPNVVGQSLVLDGRTYAVIGVMPAAFQFPDAHTRFWIPFVAANFPRMGGSPIVRLKDGVTVEAASAEVTSLLPQLRANRPPAAVPGGPPPPAPLRYEVVGVQDLLVSPVKPALIMLTWAVGFILLIAAINVANLLLARTVARRREIAVRLSVGASRGRLVRQALTESIVLAIVGGVAGVALAYGGIRLLQVLAAELPRTDVGQGVGLPRLDEITIDRTVLLFTLGTSVITGIVFGLAPALRQGRWREMDVLREGSGSSTSGFTLSGRNRIQGLLVVAEIAMATMLFIGGGLLIRSMINLSHVDPGYNASHVLTAQLSLPRGRYTGAAFTALTEEITAQLQRLPGVHSVGYARQLPMVRMRQLTLLRTTPEMPAQIPPPPPFDGRQLPEAPDARVVSRDFLKVMGVHLIAGRMFEEQDTAGRPQVMLINQTLARSGFLGEHPIGRQIYAMGRAPWEIIGIVSDVRQFGLDQEPDPQVFIDYRQEPPPQIAGPALGPPPSPYFAIRASAEPMVLASSLRSLVHERDPLATVDNIASMEQLVSNSLSRPRLYAVLTGIFAAVAVALTAIGIYGVVAYAVAQRRVELGIRMALGAQRVDVMRLVLGQSLVLTATGIVLGLAGAAALTRYLDRMLFGLTALDPATFLIVPMLFASIATLAAFVPARSATAVDPLVALR